MSRRRSTTEWFKDVFTKSLPYVAPIVGALGSYAIANTETGKKVRKFLDSPVGSKIASAGLVGAYKLSHKIRGVPDVTDRRYTGATGQHPHSFEEYMRGTPENARQAERDRRRIHLADVGDMVEVTDREPNFFDGLGNIQDEEEEVRRAMNVTSGERSPDMSYNPRRYNL